MVEGKNKNGGKPIPRGVRKLVQHVDGFLARAAACVLSKHTLAFFRSRPKGKTHSMNF
jgi:hypothetical protein